MDKVTLIDLLCPPRDMTGITKCQRTIPFSIPSGTGIVNYIDSAESLSMVNRKLFSQQKVYGIEKIQFHFTASADVAPAVPYESLAILVSVAGDTWSIHNAWTKGHALYNEMQALVLDDNPSIKGTWADFKVFLDSDHRTHVVTGAGNLQPVGYLPGEWTYATYVMPQHDVDPATGNPLPADETFVHLLGPNLGNPLTNTLLSAGLVEAYALSRATVQPNDPAIPDPIGLSESFFNLLTDSGSQEPELALVIEESNDRPPYDQVSYPGGGVNHPVACPVSLDVANAASPNGLIDGFISQCGLIEIRTEARDAQGLLVPSPAITMLVTYAPGMYKGVAAIDMGQ